MYNGNQPVEVPAVREKDFLRAGYTRLAPNTPSPLPLVDLSIKPNKEQLKKVEVINKPVVFEKEERKLPDEPLILKKEEFKDGFLINSKGTSLKELVGYLKVTTSIAKQIAENRPFNSVEDLIAKFPFDKEGIDWTSYSDINYSV